ERADTGASRRSVERRPDDDEALRLFRRHEPAGAEDLRAVQDPVVAVLHRRRLDGGAVGAAVGLGDRHGPPLGLALLEAGEETLLLLGRARRRYRGTPETRIRNGEVEAAVAPAELLDRDAHAEVLLGAFFALLLLAAVTGHGRTARHVPDHVQEVPRFLVLALVVLARDRTHGLLGHHVGHGLHVLHAVGELEVDHGTDSSLIRFRRWRARRASRRRVRRAGAARPGGRECSRGRRALARRCRRSSRPRRRRIAWRGTPHGWPAAPCRGATLLPMRAIASRRPRSPCWTA